jgi:hypothetical protein
MSCHLCGNGCMIATQAKGRIYDNQHLKYVFFPDKNIWVFALVGDLEPLVHHIMSTTQCLH